MHSIPDERAFVVGDAGDLTAGALVASPNRDFRQAVLARWSGKYARAEEAVSGADALLKLQQNAELPATVVLDCCQNDVCVEDLVRTITERYPSVEVWIGDWQSGRVERAEEENGVCPAGAPAAGRRAVWPGNTAGVVPLPGMIGSSGAMGQVYKMIRLVSPRQTSVLVMGETGTGKELVVRAIHTLSPRAAGPFVIVNCAAIPDTLLEAELFGYARGAFTGALQSRAGRIHSAQGGTLFLDEVGEVPPAVQAKLLRFLEEGEVQRLGSSDIFRVDVRVLAATNADLLERVRRADFRRDLFYRLAVFPVELPPLRERRDDILELTHYFLTRLCEQAQLPPKEISTAAAPLLLAHPWPGNVRELQHVIERAFIFAEDQRQLTRAHLVAALSLSQD